MTRRKIIYVITRMIVGGAQETAKYTAEHFSRAGHPVLLATGTEAGREGHLSVDVPEVAIPSMVRSINPRRDLQALWALYRLFRKERPAVVHARTAKARFLTPLAARLARVPVVVQTIHGFSFNNQIDRKRAMYIALERLAARLYHCNVVVSQTDLNEGLRLRILRPRNTRIIRSGVDVARLTAADPQQVAALRKQWAPAGQKLVVCIGRLSMPKTPEVVVLAAAIVAEQCPDTVFLLVGDGNKREAVEQLIAELGMKDRCLLTGLRSDAAEIMAAADILVHSSTHEGMPKTVLEAMAAGKPVIGTRVGDVGNVVREGETGLLVEAEQPEQLAEATLRLLRDPALCERLGQQAREGIYEFSLEKTVADTEALYGELGGP